MRRRLPAGVPQRRPRAGRPAAVGLAPRPLGWGGAEGTGSGTWSSSGTGSSGEGLRGAPGPGGGGSSEGRAAPGCPPAGRRVCGAEGSAAPVGAGSPRRVSLRGRWVWGASALLGGLTFRFWLPALKALPEV